MLNKFQRSSIGLRLTSDSEVEVILQLPLHPGDF